MKNSNLPKFSNSKNNFSTQNFLSLMKNTIVLFTFFTALFFSGALNAQNSGINSLKNLSHLQAQGANEDAKTKDSKELIHEDKEIKIYATTNSNQSKEYFAVNQFGDNVNLILDVAAIQNATTASAKKAGSNQTPPTNPRPPIKCKCVKKDNTTGLCTEYECSAGTVKF